MRGGLIGLAAFGIAVAYMAVPSLVGRIWPTTSDQTGFRGTGMEVIAFDSRLAEQAATDVQPAGLPGPVAPEPGEPLVGDLAAFPGSETVAGLTARNFTRLNAAIAEWVGPEAAFTAEGTPLQLLTARHVEMTRAINDEWDVHVGPTGVNCYTCHRGELVPAATWFLPEPNSRWAGPSAMYQNRASAMNYSTGLPIDAMKVYLLESDQAVGVHGTTPRNPGEPGASIYHTYQTYSLMQHFANSIGANCTYCHNTRALAEIDQHTPAWAIAQVGRAMTQDINNTWILGDAELVAPERLGPQGDVAKVNCTTCHNGAPKTFGGASAVADWPELVSAEPEY
jgi:photosynthetic reaction center cytochrome c subunit